MSRLEFIKELASLLDDLPREEKIEILKYYNGYFDEAGPEQEAAIIEELGTPEKVAAAVKAGMDEDAADCMEFTDKGIDVDKILQEYEERRKKEEQAKDSAEESRNSTYGDSFTENAYESGQSAQDGYRYEQSNQNSQDTYRYDGRHSSGRSDKNGWKMLIAILLIAIFIRLWIGLIGGVFGLAGGLIGGFFGLFGSLFGAFFGNLGGGIGSIMSGIGILFHNPLTAVMRIAVGVFRVGFSIVVIILATKLITVMCNGIGTFFRWLKRQFHRR